MFFWASFPCQALLSTHGNTVPWWTRKQWSPQLVSLWPKVGGRKLKNALKHSSSLWAIAWGAPPGWDALTSDFYLSGFYILFPSQLQHQLPRDAFSYYPMVSPFLLPSLYPSHPPHPQFQIQTPLKAKRISLLTWVKVYSCYKIYSIYSVIYFIVVTFMYLIYGKLIQTMLV